MVYNTLMRQITTLPLGCNKQTKRNHTCKFLLHTMNYEKICYFTVYSHFQVPKKCALLLILRILALAIILAY